MNSPQRRRDAEAVAEVENHFLGLRQFDFRMFALLTIERMPVKHDFLCGLSASAVNSEPR
jgi:hypothetical protein